VPFVVDASVAASWLLPDEGLSESAEAFARLASDFALVPALWWFEMRNVFVINERRGRLDSTQTSRALALLDGLPIRLDTGVDEASLLRLARQYRLSAYDAAYLEIAQRQVVPLATLDAALASAARGEGVGLLGHTTR
jgi:predicted nucleic acid-binding protein